MFEKDGQVVRFDVAQENLCFHTPRILARIVRLAQAPLQHKEVESCWLSAENHCHERSRPCAKAATSPTNIEEQGLFDGAPGNSQALTIDAEPARSERQMFGLTQNYLDYKYEFRNNS